MRNSKLQSKLTKVGEKPNPTYGLGERELKDNIEKAYKNKQIAVRAKDPVKTQKYQQEFSNNFKTLVENREKLNALKQGLPTKKASEVIKNVGKPKPMNDTQKEMMSQKVQAAYAAAKKVKKG